MMCSDLDSETGQFWHTKGHAAVHRDLFSILRPFPAHNLSTYWLIWSMYCTLVLYLSWYNWNSFFVFFYRNLPEPALPLTEATPAQPHPPNTGSHSQAVTPSQSHPHSQPHPHITPTQSHITPTQSYSHNQQQAASLNTSQRPAYNSQNNFTFDEDFNNFETLNEVELLDSQEWPDEAIQSAGGSQNEWIGETVQYDAQNEFVSDELSDECLFGFHDNGLSGSTTWGKK